MLVSGVTNSRANGSNISSYTYSYDNVGNITSVSGSTSANYTYDGLGQLVAEYYGGTELEFFYDESGAPYAFSYKANASATPVMYYYVTNLQGDVTNIVDASGNVNSTYTYNAWGKIIFSAGTMSAINPLRYRGYYYDSDTELYYLLSRYYDPEICRFVNADSSDALTTAPTVLSDKNLFAYCDNNPIIRVDCLGEVWHYVVGIGIGLATQYLADVVNNLSDGKSFSEALKPMSTSADYASAALSGLLAASGINLGGAIVANSALGGITYLANTQIRDEGFSSKDFRSSLVVGGLSGAIGGSGANGAKLRGIARTSKEVLTSAVSAKKISMYTTKLTEVYKTTITSIVRTVIAGISANWLNRK